MNKYIGAIFVVAVLVGCNALFEFVEHTGLKLAIEYIVYLILFIGAIAWAQRKVDKDGNK